MPPMTQCLSALGADIHETEDGLLIHGKPILTGGEAPALTTIGYSCTFGGGAPL